MKFKDYDIGVIVGRFQVAELHEAHIELISEVANRHKRCIIFVGVSPTMGTKEHPLDYPARKAMIEEKFPNIIVSPLSDCKSNELWSKTLDKNIRTIFPIGQVCLYGGRDSFLKCYSGSFEAREFPAGDYRSATEVREEIGQEVANTVDFRKGIIYSTQNQFPRVHTTIDIAILETQEFVEIGSKKKYKDMDFTKILLGKKPDEKLWRLPGGFVDNNETLKEACRREALEETGIAVEGDFTYIDSFVINDWRYKSTSDTVLTHLFYGYYTFGAVQAGDDLKDVEWFKLQEIKLEEIVPAHRQMIEKLKEII